MPPSALSAELLDSLRGVLGADHVRVDDETRRLRTRGKSTPDLLRARAGDLSDAPDAVVRPGTHDDVVAVLAWAVEHHVAVVPFGGGTCVTGGLAARRDGFAGLVSLDLVRMKRLVSVDHESMTAVLEPGLRGPEAEALLAAEGVLTRPLPAVLRVRDHRRLRGHPVLGPVQCRLRPLRRAGRRPAGRDAARRAPARLRARERRRAGPAPAVPGLGGCVRRHHRGHRAGAAGARGEGLRGLAVGVVRGRRRGDAHDGPGGAAADRAPALRRGRDGDQPRAARRDRRRGLRGLPDDHRLRGHAVRRRGPARGGHGAAHRTGRDAGRCGPPGEAWANGRYDAPYLRDATARRRRAGGDPRDGDVLVEPPRPSMPG